MITAVNEIQTAVKAIKIGAYEYIIKPFVVDDVLIQADCTGVLHAWDVADTSQAPTKLWTIGLPWCVESTPAVWDGQIFVGHRRGELWAIADP